MRKYGTTVVLLYGTHAYGTTSSDRFSIFCVLLCTKIIICLNRFTVFVEVHDDFGLIASSCNVLSIGIVASNEKVAPNKTAS